MKINKFKNCKSPNVNQEITIEEFFNLIKTGDTHTSLIQEIRTLGKQSLTYKTVKESNLPTFRFNFLFKIKANNHNIIKPTGLIYIDVDDTTDINLSNELIYATWKSVSNTGRGILVKVDGLTLTNFSDTYTAIGESLNIIVDAGAAKASQQTVLSYDPSIYINDNSITFKAIKKKVSNVNHQREEKELILGYDTFFKQTDRIRFDNINEYFVNENEMIPFIVFADEKEKICQPFLGKSIEAGNRNKTMFFLLSQYALLNQDKGYELLKACANEINKRFEEKYDDSKIDSIITSVLNKRDEGTNISFNFNTGSTVNQLQTYNKVSIVYNDSPTGYTNSLGYSNEVDVFDSTFIFNNNLFTNYYQFEIDKIYNPNSRLYEYNCVLPPYEINRFSLTNIIRIGDKKYTIEEADLNIVDGKTKLTLMNVATVVPTTFILPPTPPTSFTATLL